MLLKRQLHRSRGQLWPKIRERGRTSEILATRQIFPIRGRLPHRSDRQRTKRWLKGKGLASLDIKHWHSTFLQATSGIHLRLYILHSRNQALKALYSILKCIFWAVKFISEHPMNHVNNLQAGASIPQLRMLLLYCACQREA